MSIPTPAGGFTPNELLVILSIASSSIIGECSCKTDDIGARLRTYASWVRRHGSRLAELGIVHLSANGHVGTGEAAAEIVRLARASPPTVPAPCRCGSYSCGGCPKAADEIGGRQIYACGTVKQWCPATVPGLPRRVLKGSAAKAQHDGVWFRALPSLAFRNRYAEVQHPSRTQDGTRIAVGDRLSLNRAQGGGPGNESMCTVMAEAAGTLLVTWDDKAGRHVSGGFADIVMEHVLFVPGRPDPSRLTDYQRDVFKAVQSGEITPLSGEKGVIAMLDGRRVPPRTFEILVEDGFLPPPAGDLLEPAFQISRAAAAAPVIR